MDHLLLALYHVFVVENCCDWSIAEGKKGQGGNCMEEVESSDCVDEWNCICQFGTCSLLMMIWCFLVLFFLFLFLFLLFLLEETAHSSLGINKKKTNHLTPYIAVNIQLGQFILGPTTTWAKFIRCSHFFLFVLI